MAMFTFSLGGQISAAENMAGNERECPAMAWLCRE